MLRKFKLREVFKPRFFILVRDRNYSKETFMSDLIAGIIVGIVAIPLAIAFGIASGVTPQQGIITAIIAGFIISFLGGSTVQIGGPTGAFIVIVYGIVLDFGMNGLIIATVLAGIMLVAMGIFRLGNLIKFMPYPIIVGFTSGIAVVIFSSQIKDFFGLDMGNPPADFIDKWVQYFQYITTINPAATIIAVVTVLIIIFWPKITSKIPGSLIAIVATTLFVFLLHRFTYIEVETIGSKFPELAGGVPLPSPEYPKFSMKVIRTLIQPALTIAILCAIESLLSAMVADGVTGKKHHSNTELIAQGVANIVTPFFGGIPATGAIARTMTNVNNGGKTPVAGIIHAFVLVAIYLVLMPLAVHIPLACLAGVLVMVAYNMSEWRSFKAILKSHRSDIAVLITTFSLTVIVDLTIAIQVGLIIALVTFFKRVSDTSNIELINSKIAEDDEESVSLEEPLEIPAGVDVYKISGPFSFGIANRFDEVDTRGKNKPKLRILRMRDVPFIDSTGIQNLRTLLTKSKSEKIRLLLSGVSQEVYSTLEKAGFIQELGEEFIFDDTRKALIKAETLVKEMKIKKVETATKVGTTKNDR